jgi:diguanylate cyclase (GGDEF)-like protein
MRADAPSALPSARRTPISRVRETALWKTPRSPRAFILSTELLCVTWLIVANFVIVPDLADLRRFVLLFCLVALYSEGSDRIERLRRFAGYVDNSVFVEGSSQWCLAAALVFSPGLAGLFVVLLYAHTLLRARRHHATQSYRLIFTGTSAVVAAMTSATIVDAFGVDRMALGRSPWALLAVVAALVGYTLVQESLIVTVLWLIRRPIRLGQIVTGANERAMEFATLALGVLLAVTVLHAPYLSPVVVLVVVVLRRSALVRELQVQATRDAKTGLLNAGAWRQDALRELARAERVDAPITVFMIDLDHFKLLNDVYGHPAGDAALKAVADCITDALRGYDAVGRYGGEEFVALLTEVDPERSVAVAKRICDRIRALRLPHGGSITASIGVGVGRSEAHNLDELISVADQALYVAKNSGRDRVHAMHAAVHVE